MNDRAKLKLLVRKLQLATLDLSLALALDDDGELARTIDAARDAMLEVDYYYAATETRAPYDDPACEARQCDYCGKTYRGPGVYCSLECALADA